MAKTMEDLDRYWKQQMGTPENQRPDALERAMHGAIGAPGESVELDPLDDPLMLNDSQYDKRKQIMATMQKYHDNTGPFAPTFYVEWDDRTRVEASRFYVFQTQVAHAALTRGATIREASALSYLTPEAVRQLAAEYQIDAR